MFKNQFINEIFSQVNLYNELMSIKVKEILIVSSLYDAFIMEENSSLASRITNEYRGLNLSSPPKLTLASSAKKALLMLENDKKYDMVITMPNLSDMNLFSLSMRIKAINPNIPVILLSHTVKGVTSSPETMVCKDIDETYIWSGDADLLLAIIKNVEDRWNAFLDTQKAMVRVLIFVEDSPVYRSFFLPIMYRIVVSQTQKVMGASLNEEHRFLAMRARPKILLAYNYEDAVSLYRKYKPYLLGVISDTRYPRNCVMDDDAGYIFLSKVKKEVPEVPLLLLSTDPSNEKKACNIPAIFLDKNSPNLQASVNDFFLNYLGFGDFVFRTSEDKIITRASNLHNLEKKLALIPDESILYHAQKNHFSNWIMARSEIALASKFRKVKISDFESVSEIRKYLIDNIRSLRICRQKGVVANFNINTFDPSIIDFAKIGNGSLGGKARGIAFMLSELWKRRDLHKKYNNININIPKTLVISTDIFKEYIEKNKLLNICNMDMDDSEITDIFLNGKIPSNIMRKLEFYLTLVKYPLSVRSSSLLEDAHYQPYAGLYQTYMIPNNHSDLNLRLNHLIKAIKLVYASTYFQDPKAFSKNIAINPQEEKMAVIIQQLAGKQYGDYFYPAISGVAQSHNFYPIGPMKMEDGIVHIALGMGKTVVEGEKTLRFCPKYPETLPQFSNVDDILSNSQRYFYALKIKNYPDDLNFNKFSNLEKIEIDDHDNQYPIKNLASTYIPIDHKIRDSGYIKGPKVLTFAQILKYNLFPLPELLDNLLEIGKKSMGCPVEIEFSVNLDEKNKKHEFYFLQIRPMVAGLNSNDILITPSECKIAFCYSEKALGNGKDSSVQDIVYVKLDSFKKDSTVQIAKEIGDINKILLKADRPYLLAGPGRWGSSDRWLGIPVQWRDISCVKAIVELRNSQLKADPSQGSHFFQNITSLGIHYITVSENSSDFFKFDWLNNLKSENETTFIKHVHLQKPITIKIDGKSSQCVMFEGE